jgi:hypothetical protein
MKHLKLYSFLIYCAILTVAVDAVCGEGAHGGGNPILIRKSQIIQELHKMPEYMRIIAKVTNYKVSLSSPAKEMFADLIKRDFLGDLASPYKIVDSKLGTGECLVNGVRAPAVSKLGDVRGEICFDVDIILSLNTTLSELIGLAFHEYAHHFNYLDQDHFLAASIAEAYVGLLPEASGLTRYGSDFVCVDPERHPRVEIFGTTDKYGYDFCTRKLDLRSADQKAYRLTCLVYQTGAAYLKSINGESIELFSAKLGKRDAGLRQQWILFSKDCARDLANLANENGLFR